MKVLVAEDDPATLSRICSLVQSWGHQCLPARDGTTASKLLRRHHPGLVITDGMMPTPDGLSLLKQIQDQPLRPTYVIFLTGKGRASHLDEAMESGADDFLRQPFDPEELRVRVRAGARILDQQHELETANAELAMAYLKLHVAKGRLRSELEASAEIQESFLPAEPPPTRQATFAWYHRACATHSGDTFNFVPLDRDRVGLFMASFSGEGVGSTLTSAHLSLTMNRHGAHDDPSLPLENPAAVAHWLNDRFSYFDRLRYFTLLYGILDFRDLTFRFTSAAHPGPMLLSHGRTRLFKVTPPAVGLHKDAQFRNRRLRLHPGDRLFVYNPGFLEMENALGESFTEDELAGLLLEEALAPLHVTLQRAGEQALAWAKPGALRRDLCLVGVEVNTGSGPA